MNHDVVAEGLRFPEGPVCLDDGTVFFVEIARGTLSRLAGGRVEVVADLGGGPNGAALGPDGMVYVCNNGGRFQFVERDGMLFPGRRPEDHSGGSIQRVDPATGRWSTLYAECGSRALLAPNDLVFDLHGGFWFTDHGTGAGDGGIYYARADGSRIVRVLDRRTSPNGIGLSPDGAKLHYADTMLRQLRGLAVIAPGHLAVPVDEGEEIQSQGPDGGIFDSLAVEADGSVCVGTLGNGGITRCGSDGQSEHIAVPDPMVTNICFGGADMRDAYITLSATGRLARTRWPSPGLRLNWQR